MDSTKITTIKITPLLSFCSLGVLGVAPLASAQMPTLTGVLAFHVSKKSTPEHTVAPGSQEDGRLRVYDFQTSKLIKAEEIAGWPIQACKNPHFSLDGKTLLFMGYTDDTDGWDVYLWKFQEPITADNPKNLTQGRNTRDEDPNWMPDGNIIYKKGRVINQQLVGQLARLTIDGTDLGDLVDNSGSQEQSAPSFSANEKKILYFEGTNEDNGKNQDVYFCKPDGTGRTKLSDPLINKSDRADYFPVGWKDSRFLYVRWASKTNHYDQIYRGDLAHQDQASVPLPFNDPTTDNSDPCPIDNRFIIYSRFVPEQGYNLFLGDAQTGSKWSLNKVAPTLKTNDYELGAAYYAPPAASKAPVKAPVTLKSGASGPKI